MSIFKKKKSQHVWTLYNTDWDVAVSGQFSPENLSLSVRGRIANAPVYGEDDPILAWVGGESDRVTFRVTVFGDGPYDNVKETLDQVLAMVKKQPDLNRPPICIFEIGRAIESFTCLVEEVSGVDFHDRFSIAGFPLHISFNLTLIKYRDYSTDPTDPTVPPSLSRLRSFKAGDSYESIAREEYGDPMFGVVLRQQNELLEPAAGEKVHIFPADYMRNIPQAPEAHVFNLEDQTIVDLLDDIVTERGGDVS